MKPQCVEQEDSRCSRTNDVSPCSRIWLHRLQDRCHRETAAVAPRWQNGWHRLRVQIVCTQVAGAGRSFPSSRTTQPPCCNRTTRPLWHNQRCASFSKVPSGWQREILLRELVPLRTDLFEHDLPRLGGKSPLLLQAN